MMPAEENSTAESGASRRGLSQPAHVLLVLAAVIVGIFDHSTRGWGPPITASAAALLFLILYWRDCWDRASFWAAVMLLAVAQVPVVIFTRPIIERNRLYMFVLMIADWAVCTLATTLLAQLDSDSPLNSRNYKSRRQRSS